VGDILVLEEYNPDTWTYSGEAISRKVIYKLAGGFGLQDGFCVLGMGLLDTEANRPGRLRLGTAAGKENTMRYGVIRDTVAMTLPLEGDMAEIGVWRGASAAVAHGVAPHKTLHLYDTFQGVVKADSSVDVHSNGDFSDTTVETVREALGWTLDETRLVFHVGEFPSTFTEQDRKFCFVYSDTDTYFGTKATLAIFAPRMVPGGKIMFDDYEWHGCPGVKKAITEFLIENEGIQHAIAEPRQFILTF